MESKPRRVSRIAAAVLWLVPGSMVLGTNCTKDLRDSVMDAGVGFVGDSVGDALATLFPVGDWLDVAAGPKPE